MPGFIDNHSHADYNIQDHPDALALVNQGITTEAGEGHDVGYRVDVPVQAFRILE